MVMLNNALQLPQAVGPVFADSASISPWAEDAVNRVTALGLFAGDGSGLLHPGGQLTRGEAAVVFCKVLDRL